MKIALGLEYCGSNYYGWQTQSHAISVQAKVESALSSVADENISVVCAGRTDAGVHALHQVIHFETTRQREPKAWVFGGNVHLPADISFIWAKPVADDFHARFSARSRGYRYVILNRAARAGLFTSQMTWEYCYLDTNLMNEAASCLLGEHDFSAYRGRDCQAKTPVRTVRHLEIKRHNDFVVIDIEANAFLHHMVRNIAGVLIAIGTGKEPVEWAREVLEGRDRRLGGITAPPHGLYLRTIEYPEAYQIPANAGIDWPLVV